MIIANLPVGRGFTPAVYASHSVRICTVGRGNMPCKQGVIFLLLSKSDMRFARDMPAGVRGLHRRAVPWCRRVRKALTLIKAWLLVCLAMNFRKTQTSARFVAMAIPKIRSGFGSVP